MSDPGGSYLRTKSSFSGGHTNGVMADEGQEEIKKINSFQNFGETRAELFFWVGEVDDWSENCEEAQNSELAAIPGVRFPQTAPFENYSFDLSNALFWISF